MKEFLESSKRDDVMLDPAATSAIFAAAMEIQGACKRNHGVNHIKAATLLVIYSKATYKSEVTRKAKLKEGIDSFIAWENNPKNSPERELKFLSDVTQMLSKAVLVRSRAAEIARDVLFSLRLSDTTLEKSEAFHAKVLDEIIKSTVESVFAGANIEIPPMP